MPAPLTAQQIALYMSKRRAGSRQEVAAAAAGISVSSAHRIDHGRIQPKAAKPRGRRRPDPLAEVWDPLLLPLLERHPALTPTTLLEHLQEQKPDQDWSSVKRERFVFKTLAVVIGTQLLIYSLAAGVSAERALGGKPVGQICPGTLEKLQSGFDSTLNLLLALQGGAALFRFGGTPER